MKKTVFLSLLILVFFNSKSQNYSNDYGRLKFGLNIGGTYQTADIKNDLFGLGFGATLEYAIIQNNYSIIGFSLRGRYLYGTTYGADIALHNGDISNNALNGFDNSLNNYSNTALFLNNKTKLNEYSLEAIFKFNKLYIQHGFLFYLFIGGGATGYNSTTNQFDALGNKYDYSTINLNTNVKSKLTSLQDLSYETELSNPNTNNFVFTPTVGLGIGFRVAPFLTIAFEHKISLPQTDYFDGQVYHPVSQPSFIKDIYHYTSIGFIFYTFKSNNNPDQTYITPQTYTAHPKPTIQPTPPTQPITSPASPSSPPTPISPSVPISAPIIDPKPPIITLINPVSTTFNTPNCKVSIEVKIENVTNENDIEFFQNNLKVASYLYYFQSGILHSTTDLTNGENNFKVIAKNTVKSTQKDFNLSCNSAVEKTILICHKNSNGATQKIEIKESEWQSHKLHGDNLGDCAILKKIIICHLDTITKVKTTIEIPENEWSIHKNHSDVLGECSKKIISQQIQICHNDRETGKITNLYINEKDWFAHAAHGDSKGVCPIDIKNITICHTDPNSKVRATIEIPENEWPIHQTHGDVLGECIKKIATQQIQICHNDKETGKKSNIIIEESDWFNHAGHGDSKGLCPIEIKKITICHSDTITKVKTTIEIPENEWPIHQNHGDVLGECSKKIISQQIQICHINQTNGELEPISINQSELSIHQSHGDIIGSCEGFDQTIISICFNKKNKKIKKYLLAYYQELGAVIGSCNQDTPPNVDSIEICHNIAENGTKETITIPSSEWPSHQNHGDVLGKCAQSSGNPKTNFNICHTDSQTGITTTMNVTSQEWGAHLSHGDVLGSCPIINNPKIKICHIPPGNNQNPQTIEIPESAWPAHEAHGDYKGECNVIPNKPLKNGKIN